jgi:NhaA family Na+:H+ antiporter
VSSNASPGIRLAPHELWRRFGAKARSDIFAGVLLLAATTAALIVANTAALPWYESVRDFRFGIDALRLELSVGSWAADGLLAIFFFVIGLELKEEFVDGKLSDPRRAALPIAAGVGGVIVPAVVFIAIASAAGPVALRGWAIPTATDIAFAVAVFAVVGKFLPPALRVFLLTLAIVDDLIAITIIAVFYTAALEPIWLILAIVPLALFALAAHRGVRAWWVLLPLAFTTWALVHASGVHATVAGVLLGFAVPVAATLRARVRVATDPDGTPVYEGLAAHFADRWSLVATLVAVPVFAFFAAGVPIGGADGLVRALSDPVTLAIIAGLLFGKPLGVLGATFLLTRHRALRLDPTLTWPDLVGMAVVAGIGLTVSLLVGELAFGPTAIPEEHVKIGVLVGSLLAALIGGSMLAIRSRRYHRALDRSAVRR